MTVKKLIDMINNGTVRTTDNVAIKFNVNSQSTMMIIDDNSVKTYFADNTNKFICPDIVESFIVDSFNVGTDFIILCHCGGFEAES